MRTVSDQSGFTFVEAVIAIVVIGIGLVGLTTIFANSAQNVAGIDQSVTATYLASERLEQLISNRHAGGYNTVAVGTTTEASVAGFAGFSRVTTIQFVQPSGSIFDVVQSDAGYKKIQVTVSWVAPAGSVVLESLVTNWVVQ